MRRRSVLKLFALSGLLANKQHVLAKQATHLGTGIVFDPVFLQHSLGAGHPESPQRVQAVVERLENSSYIDKLSKVAFSIEPKQWLETMHSAAHIASIQRHHPKTHNIACQVISGILSAVHEVGNGHLKNAFCLTRPPGHHAQNTGQEEGFCFYNGIAIAARYAQKALGFKKILIVDWDYHHGNATEAMFYDDPSVLFFSTHDFHAYPGTGDPKRTGNEAGRGYNINIHLPCGTEDAEFIACYAEQLIPAAQSFKPDMILISAGFDSRAGDLLGCFNVSDNAYVSITQLLMQLADVTAAGRIVSVLEGGYTPTGLASAIEAHISALLGISDNKPHRQSN